MARKSNLSDKEREIMYQNVALLITWVSTEISKNFPAGINENDLHNSFLIPQHSGEKQYIFSFTSPQSVDIVPVLK